VLTRTTELEQHSYGDQSLRSCVCANHRGGGGVRCTLVLDLCRDYVPEQHSYMYATSITAQAVVLEAEEGGGGGEYEYDWVYMWLHALHARTYTAF
jgi:hypothetical protein